MHFFAGAVPKQVWAVLTAVVGPAAAISAWLVVTYSYRQDKLMIVKEVGKRVSNAELGSGAADDAVGNRRGLSVSPSTSSHSSGVHLQPRTIALPLSSICSSPVLLDIYTNFGRGAGGIPALLHLLLMTSYNVVHSTFGSRN